MKPETFYRKYYNMPLENKGVPIMYFTDGIPSSISPHAMYEMLNEAIEKECQAKKEVNRLLKIANKIL